MHGVADGGTLFTKGGLFPLDSAFCPGGQCSLVNIVRGDTFHGGTQFPSDTGRLTLYYKGGSGFQFGQQVLGSTTV